MADAEKDPPAVGQRQAVDGDTKGQETAQPMDIDLPVFSAESKTNIAGQPLSAGICLYRKKESAKQENQARQPPYECSDGFVDRFLQFRDPLKRLSDADIYLKSVVDFPSIQRKRRVQAKGRQRSEIPQTDAGAPEQILFEIGVFRSEGIAAVQKGNNSHFLRYFHPKFR